MAFLGEFDQVPEEVRITGNAGISVGIRRHSLDHFRCFHSLQTRGRHRQATAGAWSVDLFYFAWQGYEWVTESHPRAFGGRKDVRRIRVDVTRPDTILRNDFSRYVPGRGLR